MSRQILLIDAYSQIFRCYYAITYLSNSRGEPTNALFAFTRLLLNLEKEFRGCDGALLFDCGKPAFRLELAPDYKAGRPPMPEDLRFQMPLIREMAEAFGWPLLQKENYEADDLIGGFATGALPGECEVFVVTSDKDLAQLVRPGVTWLAPDRKNSGFEKRGVPGVIEKFGVPPERLVDYLSLLGDSSDNIPGVPGIGGKTAARLLADGRSLDQVLADPAAAGASPRIAEALKEHAGRIAVNRQLIRLRCDLPEEFADRGQTLKRHQPDWAEIAELCRAQDLKSLLKELPEEFREAPAAPAPPAAMVQDDLFG